MQNGK